MLGNDEHATNLIFRELRNTATVAKNAVSDQVVAVLGEGGTFADVREPVAGHRGRAGIWWAGLPRL